MAISILRTPSTRLAVRNNVDLQVLADNSWSDYDDYYVKLLILKETSFLIGDYTEIDMDIRGYPDSTRKINFNLSRLIRPLVGNNQPAHVETSSTGVIASNTVATFKFSIQEWKDGVLDVSSSIGSAIHWAYNAGFYFMNSQYMASWIDKKQFLTHQPRHKLITSIQPEYLYLITSTNLEEIEVKCNLYHSDGSTTAAYDPGISVYNFANTPAYFAVGFQQLGLDAIAPDVIKYDVYVESASGDPLSEVQTYELVPSVDSERYYMFQNSLGGYDVVRTSGDLSYRMPTSGISYEAVKTGANNRRIYSGETIHQDVFTQHIGNLNEDENAWLRDLYRSRDVVRFGSHRPFDKHKDYTYIPIHLQRGNVEVRNDNDLLYPLSFQYTESNINTGL